MYSINKYKLLRHTSVSVVFRGRPLAVWTEMTSPETSCIVKLLLNSRLVGYQLWILIYTTTFYTVGHKAGWMYTAHRHRCSPNMTSWPLNPLLFADSCFQVGLVEPPPYCLHLYCPSARGSKCRESRSQRWVWDAAEWVRQGWHLGPIPNRPLHTPPPWKS